MMYGLSIGECHVTFPGLCLKTTHSMSAQRMIFQRLLKKSWKSQNRYTNSDTSTMYSGVWSMCFVEVGRWGGGGGGWGV